MLVSGGKIIAIDSVNTEETIYGDGVNAPLSVNTDLIATVDSVKSISANFDNYYAKNETSGADQLKQAFDDIKQETGTKLCLSVNNTTIVFTEV